VKKPQTLNQPTVEPTEHELKVSRSNSDSLLNAELKKATELKSPNGWDLNSGAKTPILSANEETTVMQPETLIKSPQLPLSSIPSQRLITNEIHSAVQAVSQVVAQDKPTQISKKDIVFAKRSKSTMESPGESRDRP
jgi:hypothetical protein